MNTFSIEEALSFGWRKTKEHFWFLVGMGAILFLIMLVIQLLLNTLRINEESAGGVVFLFIWLVCIIFQFGVMKITLKIVDGQTVIYKDLVPEKKLLFYFIVAVVLSGIIAAIGTVFFIIPGIIFSLALSLSGYLVLDKKLKPIEAIKESWRITKGSRMQLFIFGVAAGLVNTLGFLALGIGLLWTIPTVLIAYALIYRKISNTSSEGNLPVVATPIQPVVTTV